MFTFCILPAVLPEATGLKQTSISGLAQGTLLTTPGATKFYRSEHGGGEQHISIDVGPGAVCEYLPQETILFDGAVATMEMQVSLAAGASYVGWDFLSLGRPAANEKFRAGRISQRVQVFEGGKPIWCERLQLTGDLPLSLASYALADQPILGTMIYAGDAAKDCAERVRGPLDERAQNVFSVSQLERVIVCRYLGRRLSRGQAPLCRCVGRAPDSVPRQVGNHSADMGDLGTGERGRMRWNFHREKKTNLSSSPPACWRNAARRVVSN